MRSILFLAFVISFLNSYSYPKKGIEGNWIVQLRIQGQKLPFQFKLEQERETLIAEIHNGKEIISIKEIKKSGDSIIARLPVFDSELHFILKGDSLSGYWLNLSRKSNQKIDLFGSRSPKVSNFRFPVSKESKDSISGKWEVKFSPNSADSSVALGVFNQQKNLVTGTFLTSTGDYRFLDGVIDGDSLKLSTFDGSHAFLFLAKIYGNKINGMFYSGNHWKEPWIAKRNDNYELPNPDSLTFLNPGYQEIDFKFPNLKGDSVSLKDPEFKGKVVIIQIMGSWCPNCMDETAYLSEFYKESREKGIEIIGLAYEKALDKTRITYNIQRLVDRYKVEYPILIAGSSNKAEASKTLPMLNEILSFPTTIIVDKKGKIRKIHTGFSGPATGVYFEKFEREFKAFIQKLTKE